MTPSVRIRAVLFILAAAGSSACGADSTTPATASGPSLFVAQVGGQWSGTSSLVNVTGLVGSNAECVGTDVAERLRTSVLATEPVALSLTQDSASVSGRLTSASSGLSCAYKGNAALTSLAMDASSCDAPLLVVRCNRNPIDGSERVRDLKLVGSSLSGNIAGSSAGGRITGTMTNTYNMFETGTSDGVASLVLNYSYSINR
jgi:hypothetical protein